MPRGNHGVVCCCIHHSLQSSDHGAFNSWDRLPYLTLERNGSLSSIPATQEVHSNFIVANYQANGGCLDNDGLGWKSFRVSWFDADGSSFYHIHDNFCVFGGHKSDFDGHSKISSNNIHIFPQVYGARCMAILAQNLPPEGYAEGYINNTCILSEKNQAIIQFSIDVIDCSSAEGVNAIKSGWLSSDNKIYVPEGQALVQCNSEVHNSSILSQWGVDSSTQVYNGIPSSSTIIDWGKRLLIH